ncbi:MAG: AmmeMemoRadiSam system radical SAM enzyme [Candidatus Margulisbacteria bacterium]|nr:AmmeMemoRadiSam system radical SAM enzyme [Candidatus Margulisiibacteriota bacterium]
MKKANYYHSYPGKKVQCLLCPNKCMISPDKKGFCDIRQNKNGVLYNSIYNAYSSIAVDPIEKKPLYHFYPGSQILSLGSIGCNFKCRHCQNWQISQPGRNSVKREMQCIEPEEILNMTTKYYLDMVAFTYNEPNINFETIFEAAKLLKNNDKKVVSVTNGYVCLEPLAELMPYIDAYSIDLKAFTDKAYTKLTGVNAKENVQQVIDFLVKKEKHIELVWNLVTDINTDLGQIEEAFDWVASLSKYIPFHITVFFPNLDFADKMPVPGDVVSAATCLAKEKGLKYVYSSSSEDTLCPNCNFYLIKRRHFQIIENNTAGKICKNCHKVIPWFIN